MSSQEFGQVWLAHGGFQIPMRGNETIKVVPILLSLEEFQIPMRGNETVYDATLPERQRSSKSP